MNKPEVEYLEVPSSQLGRRLDNFLFSKIKGVPKSHIYAIIRSGQVRINRKRIKPAAKLQPGDLIRLPPLRKSAPKTAKPQTSLVANVRASIIHEDKDLLVLNKPRGLIAHGGARRPFGAIETLWHIYNTKEIYLAHRLDLETTGVLIFARNLTTLRQLHKVWRTAACRKFYYLIVQGSWQPKQIKLISHLRRSQKSGEFVMESRPAAPYTKQAVTLFRLLGQEAASSLLEAEILTGRTHQVRLQAAQQGHPILGDRKYAYLQPATKANNHSKSALALHCYRLEFSLDGQEYEFSAPPPEVFAHYSKYFK